MVRGNNRTDQSRQAAARRPKAPTRTEAAGPRGRRGGVA